MKLNQTVQTIKQRFHQLNAMIHLLQKSCFLHYPSGLVCSIAEIQGYTQLVRDAQEDQTSM